MGDKGDLGDLGHLELEGAGREPHSKLGGSLADRLAAIDGSETLDAIIKVDEAGYVPPAASRRANISDTLFTASVRRGQLEELEHDPRVVSIELKRRLRRID